MAIIIIGKTSRPAVNAVGINQRKKQVAANILRRAKTEQNRQDSLLTFSAFFVGSTKHLVLIIMGTKPLTNHRNKTPSGRVISKLFKNSLDYAYEVSKLI